MTELIRVTQHDHGILQVSLNQPQTLNALSHEMLQQLQKIIDAAKHDASVKALLLTGEGKGFCAGANIKELSLLNGQSGLMFARYGQSVFRNLELLGKPSLAAIQGFAFGGGSELAMAATLRIADSNATFGQPEIKLGVIPGFGGTQRLARLIGRGRALDICLTGRRFNAQEAHQWGWLNEVTDAANLHQRAMAILQEISQFSSIALQSIMSGIYQGADLSLEEAQELEAAHFGLCCTTADKREGVMAFLEKRAPVFQGE